MAGPSMWVHQPDSWTEQWVGSEIRVDAETNVFLYIDNEQEKLGSIHNFISTNAS